MNLIKSTSYAPDIYRALNGILLVYKPPRVTIKDFVQDFRDSISDSLNECEPRPLSKRLLIEGNIDEEKRLVEVPNLADHPLVVGPRYNPWELSLSVVKPTISFRTSGLCVFLLGSANKYYHSKMRNANFVSVYHIKGRFGYATDTFLYDGRIMDKATYKHIRPGKLDSVLSRIESTQYERLFDSSTVPIDSQEAYELAKAWPSRPPKMAQWPVIYRIRCIHLKLPEFKVEVTVTNENEQFLAQLPHDIGIMLKSNAFTESIRRVKQGPFDINDSLTDKEWDLQSIVDNLAIYNAKRDELTKLLREHRQAMSVRTDFSQREGSD